MAAKTRRFGVRAAAAAAGALVLLLPLHGEVGAQTSTVKGLTAGRAVARAYDAIFDARLDEAPEARASVCAPARPATRDERAPAEVCRLLDALALWWRIRLDVLDQSHDQAFAQQADAAIAAAEAWVAREPQRAEAWFYLGASYAARAQFRTQRGRQLAAARDGKRIKESMERAVALDPAMQDARFGLGLYQYYADVGPAALKLLRWLLLLPGGDKAAGLRTMEQARERAQLVRSEAAYQLHLVYLWYENAPQRALELAQDLRARHPYNPHFMALEAEILDVHLSNVSASLRAWRSLLDAAGAKKVAAPGMAAALARHGVALQLDRLGETDVAIEELRTLLATQPTSPVGIRSRAHVALGQALDRIGLRAEAVVQYKAALATLPPGDPLRMGVVARDAMRAPPNPDTALAYRLSLEGWRAFERDLLPEASRLLARSLALRPAEPTTRYRQARLWLAERRTENGVEALESVISDPATPPHVFANACYQAARALEQQGATARAIELYRLVTGAFDVDPSMKAEAQRALARMAA